jgi:hypothetical protein
MAGFGSRRYKQLLDDVRISKALADYYKEELRLSINAPERVVDWAIHHEISIACFKCYEHDEYFTELDTLFPHHWEDCKCPKCDLVNLSK